MKFLTELVLALGLAALVCLFLYLVFRLVTS